MIDVRVVTVDRYVPGGSNFTTTIWNNLPNIRYKFVLSDKGDASWEVPLSHPQLTQDGFAPVSHDFRIGVNNNGAGWRTAHEGIIGPVGLQSESQLVSVQGFDYLWWLEQPYHFTGYEVDSNSWSKDDLIVLWNNQSQQRVITDLLNDMYTTSLRSVRFTPTFTGSNWSEVLVDFEMAGSTTSVLDKIKSVGALNDPYGFEFWMGVASSVTGSKPIYFASPRRVTQANAQAAAIAYFTPSSNTGLLSINWTNNGPKAISTVGISPSGIGLKGFSTYTPSKDTYRDWYDIYQFTNAYKMVGQVPIDSATDAMGSFNRNPQKELTITFMPEQAGGSGNEDFWFFTQVGEYVWVDSEDWFMPYHRIQSAFKVIGQEMAGDNAGNWICTLNLQQVYA